MCAPPRLDSIFITGRRISVLPNHVLVASLAPCFPYGIRSDR